MAESFAPSSLPLYICTSGPKDLIPRRRYHAHAQISAWPCSLQHHVHHHATTNNNNNEGNDDNRSTPLTTRLDSTTTPVKKRTVRRPPRIRRVRPTHSESDRKYPDGAQHGNKNSISSNVDGRSTDGTDTAEFASRSDIHPLTRRAIDEVLRLKEMTPIQSLTYDAALNGKDVLAQSKTGSGKTLAYLLPAIQRILDGDVVWYGRSVAMIVLVPTRELAIQVADQAESLLTFHHATKSSPLFAGDGGSSSSSSSTVACLYGGVKMHRDRRLLSSSSSGGLPAIVIATPGRLLQHLQGTRLDDGRKFCNVVDETQMVVLDETDRLLEAFPHETKRILSYLARAEKRQNLLFSATFPRALRETLMTGETGIVKGEVVEISPSGMEKKQDRKNRYGTNIRQNDSSSATGQQLAIEQSYVSIKDIGSQYMELLLAILRREISDSPLDYKIIVFFPTGWLVRFMYQFFTTSGVLKRIMTNNNIWEIHSRMSQPSRMKSSDAFRTATNGILFSSDVSQRGLDYPDVSLVVQYGAPRSRNDYTHRIGRTGRAGKSGKGILVLMPFEDNSRSKRGIKIDGEVTDWLQEEQDDEGVLSHSRQDLESCRWKVRSHHSTLTPNAESAVSSFLAHYLPRGRKRGGDNTSGRRRGKSTMITGKQTLQYAEDFASAIGLPELPELDPRLKDRIEE